MALRLQQTSGREELQRAVAELQPCFQQRYHRYVHRAVHSEAVRHSTAAGRYKLSGQQDHRLRHLRGVRRGLQRAPSGG